MLAFEDLGNFLYQIPQKFIGFGLDCEDIACESGKRCIISRIPCNGPDQQDGVQCGTYPECEKDQLARDFSIDTTLNIAPDTRSSIIIPSTSTNRIRTDTDTDTDFELLTDLGNPDNSATHAGQTQANVLVIVQDGSQPQLQPSPWLNRRQNVPCTVNPLYPYACNYPGYVPNPGVGLPSYPQARSASGPQLVPPTPPCYYNCFPRVGASPYGQYRGYPLARSANPSSTNNYLLYLTLSSG
ncbi:hypothetical protein KR054_012228 [Drosophila jambulina]|nr:hypothetical protein KR054_012228 [Drosophila jambulina]